MNPGKPLSFAKRLTIERLSAIITVLVSGFGYKPNTVIRVFTVSFTCFGEWHFFVSEPILYN